MKSQVRKKKKKTLLGEKHGPDPQIVESTELAGVVGEHRSTSPPATLPADADPNGLGRPPCTAR